MQLCACPDMPTFRLFFFSFFFADFARLALPPLFGASSSRRRTGCPPPSPASPASSAAAVLASASYGEQGRGVPVTT